MEKWMIPRLGNTQDALWASCNTRKCLKKQKTNKKPVRHVRGTQNLTYKSSQWPQMKQFEQQNKYCSTGL